MRFGVLVLRLVCVNTHHLLQDLARLLRNCVPILVMADDYAE